MARPLGYTSFPRRMRSLDERLTAQERKPNLRGRKVYVGDFVGVDDPGNDPADTTGDSPPWLNSFIYLDGYPVWYAHGLDGETDMGGMYDLTQGAVSNTIAFMMPLEWARQAPPTHMFPVKIDDGVYTIAIQEITLTGSGGEVRIIWPIVAETYVFA